MARNGTEVRLVLLISLFFFYYLYLVFFSGDSLRVSRSNKGQLQPDTYFNVGERHYWQLEFSSADDRLPRLERWRRRGEGLSSSNHCIYLLILTCSVPLCPRVPERLFHKRA